MDISRIIREKREALGMTQDELAAKVGYSSRSAINKIEMGVNGVRRNMIEKFAEALECSPAELMGWEPITDYVVEPKIQSKGPRRKEENESDIEIEYLHKQPSPSLSNREIRLLKNFRELDDDGQRQLTLMLAFLASQHKDK